MFNFSYYKSGNVKYFGKSTGEMEEVKTEHFLKRETLLHFSNIIRYAPNERFPGLWTREGGLVGWPLKMSGLMTAFSCEVTSNVSMHKWTGWPI